MTSPSKDIKEAATRSEKSLTKTPLKKLTKPDYTTPVPARYRHPPTKHAENPAPHPQPPALAAGAEHGYFEQKSSTPKPVL